MEQEIINKAKEMLTNADTSTNDCKQYNNGFMDGVEYAIKALRQTLVSSSFSSESDHICMMYLDKQRTCMVCGKQNCC